MQPDYLSAFVIAAPTPLACQPTKWPLIPHYSRMGLACLGKDCGLHGLTSMQSSSRRGPQSAPLALVPVRLCPATAGEGMAPLGEIWKFGFVPGVL